MSIQRIDKTTGETSLLAGGTLYSTDPIGTIHIFCTNNLPSYFHECDGSELSKTEYADLYAVIGDNFKGTKTPTTGYFCLPDLRECTVKGASDTNNDTYTIATHQKITLGEFLDDRVKNITIKSGDVQIYSGAGHDRGIVAGGSADRSLGNYTTSTTGATTEVKSVGIIFGIKIRECPVPQDFMSKVDEAVEDVLSQDLVVTTPSSSNITVGGKTSGIAWSITQSKAGYTPIMYNLYYGYSSELVVSAEQVTMSDGNFSVSGYAGKWTDSSATTSIIAKVLWRKNPS